MDGRSGLGLRVCSPGFLPGTCGFSLADSQVEPLLAVPLDLLNPLLLLCVDASCRQSGTQMRDFRLKLLSSQGI